jgi:putative Holliday junction resolvase
MFLSDALPDKGVLVAIDFGKARVGLAKTDPERIVVTPIETLQVKGKSLSAIAEIIITRAGALSCAGFVIGWPDEDDERTLPLRKEIARLAQHLRHALPCAGIQESFSSRDALDHLHEANKKKKGRAQLDHYAAAVILDRYLSRQGDAPR